MKKVFVGLSGGVDSAVSAALLKERGYDVTGVFIKIWQPEFIECSWREDRLDAMRVAVALGVPFREIDLSEEYKRGIVEKMIAGYARGITPNPDVLCNKAIKFGSFLSYALSEGADYIATGHYARVRQRNGAFELLRGIDRAKDQSYFLYMLGQAELSKTLFPLGDITKKETRHLAQQFDLPVANKRDSQGLCFVGEVTIPEFLSRFLPPSEGVVFDMAGERIGTHEGAAFLTIGQRHGFRISMPGHGKPHYVVSVDTTNNSITVSERREDAAKTDCDIEDTHFIGNSIPMPFDASAQVRYHGEEMPVVIESSDGTVRARFTAPIILSPGQSLVLYREDVCIGGGIIESLQ